VVEIGPRIAVGDDPCAGVADPQGFHAPPLLAGAPVLAGEAAVQAVAGPVDLGTNRLVEAEPPANVGHVEIDARGKQYQPVSCHAMALDLRKGAGAEFGRAEERDVLGSPGAHVRATGAAHGGADQPRLELPAVPVDHIRDERSEDSGPEGGAVVAPHPAAQVRPQRVVTRDGAVEIEDGDAHGSQAQAASSRSTK
jgi:hypothetical protein